MENVRSWWSSGNMVEKHCFKANCFIYIYIYIYFLRHLSFMTSFYLGVSSYKNSPHMSFQTLRQTLKIRHNASTQTRWNLRALESSIDNHYMFLELCIIIVEKLKSHEKFWQCFWFLLWTLNISKHFLCLWRMRELSNHLKYLNLRSEDEPRSHRIGMASVCVINNRVFIFGWTNSLSASQNVLQNLLADVRLLKGSACFLENWLFFSISH